MTLQVRADSDPLRSAREALAMASPGMTPAERAEAQKALAELPTQAAMDGMKADMRREMEETMRTGSAEEADAARQALHAMQQAFNGTAVLQTTRVKERWTLISPNCSSMR